MQYIPGRTLERVVIEIVCPSFPFPVISMGVLVSSQVGLTPSAKGLLVTI